MTARRDGYEEDLVGLEIGYLTLDIFLEPLAGIIDMIDIEHGESGRLCIGTDAFSVREIRGMRDDDG